MVLITTPTPWTSSMAPTSWCYLQSTRFRNSRSRPPASAPNTAALGRTVPKGTIFDPATTRAITAGQVDPVSGFVAQSTGFARDPFGTCAPSTATFAAGACGLNNLSAAAAAGRINPNALSLLG